MQIPAFLQIMLWVAAGLTALGVIFYKGIRPVSRFITETEQTVPILREITEKLNDPKLIDVIVAIAKEFQSNSGTSLRDVINRIETAAVEAKKVTDRLTATIDSSFQDRDRDQMARLVLLLEQIQKHNDSGTK